jgi:hypothetical protein
MPICDGCGSSYDDNFRFCPHCGRANTSVQPIPVPVSREICHLDYRSKIVDRNNAETWIEATCDGKAVDKTPGMKYPFDKKIFKEKQKWGYAITEAIVHDLKSWDSVRNHFMETEKKQYRELISRLMAAGWEVASSTEKGDITVMQRTKKV